MNIQEASQHPMVDFAREQLWGTGITTVPKEFVASFDVLPDDDKRLVRAFFTGATASCPVAVRLAGDPEYGPAYQEARYTGTNVWYRYLEQGILYDSPFGNPVDLKFLGGRGEAQDKDWVPDPWERYLVGPSTYEGYILPRLIVDILRFAKASEKLDVNTEIFRALDIIAASPRNPIRSIASLAHRLIELGFDSTQIYDRLFDSGYQKETPRKYWHPIFESLSTMLPDKLQFHD